MPNSSTRPSAATFRRRRLAVALVALIIVALVVAGIFAARHFLKGKEATAASSATSSASGDVSTQVSNTPATASPSASTNAADQSQSSASATSQSSAAACKAENLVLKAATDSQRYESSSKPQFTLTVTNSGPQPCVLNAGTSQMEFLVSKGNERVFSSKDCQQNASDQPRLIPTAQPMSAQFVWQRNKTVTGCTPVESKVAVGGDATYQLVVKLGGLTSKPVDFTLAS